MTHDDETLALIAAAYEDAADACADETWHHAGDDAYSRGLDRGAAHQASACAAAVRSLTPSDAQAALDRMLRRAKNEALEKAAERFHTEQLRIYADEILGSLSIDNVLRIETYDEKVRAYQSVATELAAFPAAIRATKEPEE